MRVAPKRGLSKHCLPCQKKRKNMSHQLLMQSRYLIRHYDFANKQSFIDLVNEKNLRSNFILQAFLGKKYDEDTQSTSNRKKSKRKRSHEYEESTKRENTSLTTSGNDSSSNISSSGMYNMAILPYGCKLNLIQVEINLIILSYLTSYTNRCKKQTNAEKICYSYIKARR